MYYSLYVSLVIEVEGGKLPVIVEPDRIIRLYCMEKSLLFLSAFVLYIFRLRQTQVSFTGPKTSIKRGAQSSLSKQPRKYRLFASLKQSAATPRPV